MASRWCDVVGHDPVRVDESSDGEFVYYSVKCRRCGRMMRRGDRLQISRDARAILLNCAAMLMLAVYGVLHRLRNPDAGEWEITLTNWPLLVVMVALIYSTNRLAKGEDAE